MEIIIYSVIFICCLTLMTIAFFNTYNVFGVKRDIKNIQIKTQKGISTHRITTDEIHGKDNILNVMGELSTTGEINSSTIDTINNNIGVIDNNVQTISESTNKRLNELNNTIVANKTDTDKKIKVLNDNKNGMNIRMNEMKSQIHALEIAAVTANKKINTLESRLIRLGTAFETHDIAHSNNTYFNHI